MVKKFLAILTILAFATNCAEEPVELSDADQLQKDIEAIDAWLDINKPTALTHSSGLRYAITTLGTGVKPKLTNKVVVKYSGKFIKENVAAANSTVFDQASTATTLTLSQLIEGWQIGIQLLPKGTKATLYIPSGLAYGKKGTGSAIPANSNLFFDVELVDVK